MKFEFFIARRQMLHHVGKKRISGSLANVSVFGIALCIAVMLIAISVLTGFKTEIRNKIVGFGSHIQIQNYDSNESFEMRPISLNQDFLPELKATPGINNVQIFATKAGIIRANDNIQGIVLKGIGPDFDWGFFENNLIDGNIIELSDTARSNGTVISKTIANLLQLKTGDSYTCYFVQDPPRPRNFFVSGIYQTGVEEIDKMMVIADIGHIRRLNNWTDQQVGGFEVNVGSFENIDPMILVVNDIVGYSFTRHEESLRVTNIKDKYPQMFDWLNLQDMNVLIVLILMLAVSVFNMIAGLLILILDRTKMIGLLKALGAGNKSVRRIFIFESGFLLLKGLFWGNFTGIGLCLLQLHFGIIKLDPVTYYINQVPIYLNVWYIIALNAGTIFITILMLIVPSVIISRFSPHETMRYE